MINMGGKCIAIFLNYLIFEQQKCLTALFLTFLSQFNKKKLVFLLIFQSYNRCNAIPIKEEKSIKTNIHILIFVGGGYKYFI